MHTDLEKILFREEDILGRLDELARRISGDYAGRELTVIAVLNGGLIFAADLLRRIPLPLQLDCLGAASYHGGVRSTGRVEIDRAVMPDLAGRHVLVVDDILDTGQTLAVICERLRRESKPESLKVCVLLRKLKKRETPVEADYVGFDIGDEFVVGYGLDFQERYRNLPCIGVLRKKAALRPLSEAQRGGVN